ncbi:FimB/Mfa2 family fimbrial subunit [Dysgonomonas sp. ZJ709]|uniref:FimB/Mfa2 family fimbrial subunit n=1 Tax=Dysgonomonas sp. ZJ709 TaxID=2709797 RepID=UPI0013EB805E|nr:FimB/Mfa2 family fimbrial subunit [Dysgonomonas sp. ZJ709]
MYIKIKHFLSILALLIVCFSCGNDELAPDSRAVEVPETGTKGLQINLFNVSDNIRDYSEVYVFNGEDPNTNFFHHKILNNNIERTSESLKMTTAVGKWNFVLVACSEMDIRSRLTPPTASFIRSNTPMWVTQPSGGILPDVPEIRVATINGITITEDTYETAEAILERNVAKVRVVLADGVGFKTGAGTVSLKNVPTSLSWDGSLFPNKNTPTVGVPMTKTFAISNSPSISGHQVSDTIDFIIPAHKSTSASDFSTHLITVQVNLKTAGSTDFIKEVVVPIPPKNNKILLVSLTAKGGVEVKVDVKDWATVVSNEDVDMYAMSQISTTATMATFSMNMKQERNWWVTLEDTNNFEFVDESKTFGQKTISPATIQVRRKTSGVALSTKVNLFISGLDGLKEQYVVNNLIQ